MPAMDRRVSSSSPSASLKHKSLQVKGEAQGGRDASEEDQLALESLSMEQVLQNGTPLLASGGQVQLRTNPNQVHHLLQDLSLHIECGCLPSRWPLAGPPEQDPMVLCARMPLQQKHWLYMEVTGQTCRVHLQHRDAICRSMMTMRQMLRCRPVSAWQSSGRA